MRLPVCESSLQDATWGGMGLPVQEVWPSALERRSMVDWAPCTTPKTACFYVFVL